MNQVKKKMLNQFFINYNHSLKGEKKSIKSQKKCFRDK